MEFKQKFKKRVIKKHPTNEVLQKVSEGKKFVVVDEEFDNSFVPAGYTLVNQTYRGDVFRVLVPQESVFYIAEQEGSVDEALDDLADFYEDAEDFEDEQISEGKTSVQETDWAVTARNAYKTYLINKLVISEDDERNARFDEETLAELNLNDEFVAQRVRAMAALVLEKSGDELKEYNIDDLLKFKDAVISGETEKLSNEEFRKITKMKFVPKYDAHTKNMRCLGDSHYYLLPEYEENPDWDYDLRDMTKTGKEKPAVLEQKLHELEAEILIHRQAKHDRIGRHDSALIRQYINLKYIAKENPQAQLDIMPPKSLE